MSMVDPVVDDDPHNRLNVLATVNNAAINTMLHVSCSCDDFIFYA